jgi:hypothetical protein
MAFGSRLARPNRTYFQDSMAFLMSDPEGCSVSGPGKWRCVMQGFAIGEHDFQHCFADHLISIRRKWLRPPRTRTRNRSLL